MTVDHHKIEIKQTGKRATAYYKDEKICSYTIQESSSRLAKTGKKVPHSVIRAILAKLEKLRIKKGV